MKALKTIALAAGLALASGAYAQSMHSNNDQSRYRFNNDVQQPSPPIEPFENGKTRAEVLQELHLAIATGQIYEGEANEPLPPAHTDANVTRAQVLQELTHAREAGNLSYGELDYPTAS